MKLVAFCVFRLTAGVSIFSPTYEGDAFLCGLARLIRGQLLNTHKLLAPQNIGHWAAWSSWR
jgi:hypothetical protein